MVKKVIPFFLFFVIADSTLFSSSFALYHHPQAGVFLQWNKDARYPAKPQIEEQFQYGLSAQLIHQLHVEFTFGFSHIHPSSFSDGFQYRGYYSFYPGLSIEGHFTTGLAGKDISSPFLIPGLTVGIDAHYARYYSVDRAFFYLTTKGSFFIDLFFKEDHPLHLRLSIPINTALRRDLVYSIAAGFSFALYHKLIPKVRSGMEQSE